MTKSPLFGKFILIAVIVVGAFAFGFPPKDRISLGLDLRGGAHILMQVLTETAVESKLEQTQSWLGNGLKDKDLAYESIRAAGEASLEVRGTDPARMTEVRAVLDAVVSSWDITSLGGGSWSVTMPSDQRASHEQAAINITLDTMRNRIDAVGVAEPLIQKQGIRGDRILLQLPGVEDPERVKEIVVKPAKLEWKAVTYPPAVRDPGSWYPPDSREILLAQFGGTLPDDTEIIEQIIRSDLDDSVTTRYWPLKQVSAVSGPDLRTAYRSSDEWGNPAVSFQLTQEAGRRFEIATRENLNRIMAIVLDNTVISAPVIRATIRDSGIIEGGFSVTSAEDLALQLTSGAFPTEVEIIEERTVGPSLGKDSIRRGLWAGIAGFIGVLVFMVAYYRLSGVNAVIALALNVVLVFGVLGALPFLFSGVTKLRATLTLPGIAGLILTVGMAVDANVLIFERIREELNLGKTVRSAVDQGFGKAFMTILDCNVTTVIAAIFLAMYGTGPVRGFAVTLVIGLAASMFTAVFVSRQLFELLLSRKRRVESLSI
jgi:preprotein translocase subunit SecD